MKKKLLLKTETIRNLQTVRIVPRKELRLAKGGIKTIFESVFLCDPGDGGPGPEDTDNLCETAAGPCHTDWASCDTYVGCNTTGMC